MRQTGTEWVAPGQGSTLGELADAVGRRNRSGKRTGLLLTGRPLGPLDRDRIRDVLACVGQAETGGPRPEPERGR